MSSATGKARIAMPSVHERLARARRSAPRALALVLGVGMLGGGWGAVATITATAAAQSPEAGAATMARLRSSAAPAVAEPAHEELAVAQGRMTGSLYASALSAGVAPQVTVQLAKLFSHNLDLSRDIRRGDEFRLVFERTVAGGRTLDTGELLFAEVAADGEVHRFYRYQGPGVSKPDYFDERGRGARAFLLSTPVDGARMSSSFGMRRHPILGFNRMHQGVDFAARWGSRVVAAGDGEVVEAGRNGGYGNWVKVRHADGWETAYAHLSRYGAGIRRGRRVAQGEVIGYSGSTGSSTGPHLHYEVWKNGVRLNPKASRGPQHMALAGRDLQLFEAQRVAIDRLVAYAPGAAETPRLAVADLQRSSSPQAMRTGSAG